MIAVVAALCALGTLAGLTAWVRLVSTRALGGCQSVVQRAPFQWLLFTALLLQSITTVVVLGWAGGLFLMAAAWMVLGWIFSMTLNAWPTTTLVWARLIGWTALIVALLLELSGEFSATGIQG